MAQKRKFGSLQIAGLPQVDKSFEGLQSEVQVLLSWLEYLLRGRYGSKHDSARLQSTHRLQIQQEAFRICTRCPPENSELGRNKFEERRCLGPAVLNIDVLSFRTSLRDQF